MPRPYFQRYENRPVPQISPMSAQREMLWQFLAGMTVSFALYYLHWRWTASLNPDALLFSVVVALAETLCFLGTLLFFHDIWREDDTPQKPPPLTRAEAGLYGEGPIKVDVFLTSFDETEDILAPSIAALRALEIPENVQLEIWLCDDGDRSEMAELARRTGILYARRDGNRGFKAGNLRQALFRSRCDFLVICDADTRVFPGFLEHTLGYFRDPRVAWVQTPHWFYDIPMGRSWQAALAPFFGSRGAAALGYGMRWLTGRDKIGVDPFLSDPVLFFDVIQRRRNRNGASFCCGAGSIHRTEALFRSALSRQGVDLEKLQRRWRLSWYLRLKFALCRLSRQSIDRLKGRKSSFLPATEDTPGLLLPAVELQPFRYHVSEDLMTSILLHSDRTAGWKSVYHPQVESRMLSPWSMEAWATQRLKYAGGTLDIMLRANPIWTALGRGLGWRHRLHYAATFWSYLSMLWVPVLMLAPVLVLFTGWTPVSAYSAEFFRHLLPVLIFNEMAMAVTCKGYNPHQGQIGSITALPLQLRAFASVLRGRHPQFPTTPKTPMVSLMLRRVAPNLFLVGLMSLAAIYAFVQFWLENPDYGLPLIAVNLFWLGWNALALGRIGLAAFWHPDQEPEVPSFPSSLAEDIDVHGPTPNLT
ncbi:glycosyltransferase [Sulfitobacter sp. F26204]|uniref:glycosyltransferase n=1 Tax=Sulfitobacter sp. F26204 TaxID=2996014 RepID=UPI00225E53E5|nr:glycosyltransferase [Sulfitobacter sp. F26204]MCX7560511.1 glycosyltransferase [Sulfitobacter sp. F26204]